MRKKRLAIRISFLQLIVLGFALYCLVSFVQVRILIGQKQSKLHALEAQIAEQTTQNETIREALKKGVSDADIASVAREKLGYAYPGERVFVDASGR